MIKLTPDGLCNLKKNQSAQTNEYIYNCLRLKILAVLKRYNFGGNGFFIDQLYLVTLKCLYQKRIKTSVCGILNKTDVLPRGRDKWARYFEISDTQ